MSAIGYVSAGVNDLVRARAFYDPLTMRGMLPATPQQDRGIEQRWGRLQDGLVFVP